MKWILWYLRGTVDDGLMFDKTMGLDGCVVGFVDSNYAGDHNKRTIHKLSKVNTTIILTSIKIMY